jgi:hypothetical protein
LYQNPNNPPLYQNPNNPPYQPNNIPQPQIYNWEQNKFFSQDIYNPNRFQNYNPQRINLNNEFANNLNPYIPNNFNNEMDLKLRNEANYQDFTKNHLTDLFNSEYIPPDNSYRYKRKLFKVDKEKHKRMLELNKERYSLKETLKKLDTKFDQGIISEVDYFKTFKNLQKEIYLIEKKIQDLQESLQEVEEMRNSSRNFDKRRFYT